MQDACKGGSNIVDVVEYCNDGYAGPGECMLPYMRCRSIFPRVGARTGINALGQILGPSSLQRVSVPLAACRHLRVLPNSRWFRWREVRSTHTPSTARCLAPIDTTRCVSTVSCCQFVGFVPRGTEEVWRMRATSARTILRRACTSCASFSWSSLSSWPRSCRCTW